MLKTLILVIIMQSLLLTNIAHHHLAISILFLITSHMYRTNFGIGHSIKDIFKAHIPLGGRLGHRHNDMSFFYLVMI